MPSCWKKLGVLRALRMVTDLLETRPTWSLLQKPLHADPPETSTSQEYNWWNICPSRLEAFLRNSLGPHMLYLLSIFQTRDEPVGSGDNKATEIPHLTFCGHPWGFFRYVEDICKKRKEEVIGCRSSLEKSQKQGLESCMLKAIHHLNAITLWILLLIFLLLCHWGVTKRVFCHSLYFISASAPSCPPPLSPAAPT